MSTKTKTSCSGLVKVSSLSNTKSSQSNLRLDCIMFHNIAAKFRYLKPQETLHSSLAVQNLKSSEYFFCPRYINRQNQAFQSSYKKCHPIYKIPNLVHHKYGITTILDLIQMLTGTRWYAPIRYSRVTGCGGPILVRDNHSGAQHSSSPALVDIVSSTCVGAPKHQLQSRLPLQHTQ